MKVQYWETSRMPLKAVLFDMFDTLALINREYNYYSSALIGMHHYLISQGINVSFEKFNTAYIEARDMLYAEAEANLEEPHFNLRVSNALKKLGYNNVSSSIVQGATSSFYEVFMKHVHIDEHAMVVLKKLHGKYKLGIISNFAIPECVYKILNNNGLNELFDLVVVSAAVNKRKPSPEIFQDALKQMNISADEAAFVGDTMDADVAGAKSVGMKAVYIKRRTEKDIVSVCPDLVIVSLADLPLVLEN